MEKDKSASNPDLNKVEDNELDALLDDALEDFYKPDADAAGTSKVPNTDHGTQNAASTTKENPSLGPDDEAWSKEFMKQAAEDFERTMGQILGDENSEFTDNFMKLTQAATREMTSATSGSSVADTIAETLKSMSENAEALKNQPDEAKLARMLAELGLNGEAAADDEEPGEDSLGGLAGLLPVMQNMMQQLLSKDMLYPALKDISEKYPEWLEKNRTTLEADAFSKYERQSQYMREVCIAFEAEQATDSSETKQQRFERIMDLMQKTQECGQPPEELAGESNPALNMDALSGLSGSAANLEGGCTVM